MLGYRTAFQILLIIISVVIISTYISPQVSELKETQAETEQYKVVLESADKFNAELQRLQATAQEFSAAELRALDRYLPETVDTIAVMRDIEIIVNNNEMTLTSLAAGEPGLIAAAAVEENTVEGESRQAVNSNLSVQNFSVSVTGNYEQFKSLLQDFERNAYPLEIASIAFLSTDSIETTGEGVYTIILESYSLNSSGTEIE